MCYRISDLGLTLPHLEFSKPICLIKIFIFCAQSFNIDQTFLNTGLKTQNVEELTLFLPGEGGISPLIVCHVTPPGRNRVKPRTSKYFAHDRTFIQHEHGTFNHLQILQPIKTYIDSQLLCYGLKLGLVEISSLYKVKGHFNPGRFNPRFSNHELFNPMVQKFIVEKSGVEISFNPPSPPPPTPPNF